MEIEVAGSSEVALRNEEVNRARMQGGRSTGGPLKVTDPAALQRLMAEMKAKAEVQRDLERQREEERSKREGAAYVPPQERAKAARDAKEAFEAGNEARSLDGGKFDPKRDYYAALGLDRAASAAEVRRAYKRLALLLHPDKMAAEGEEQAAAVAARFREVTGAFDVLADEERRALYDKVRDHQEAHPNKGLPPLTPEEAAMMRSGAGELSRLRRQGPKVGKHPPLERDIVVALARLNAGCTKALLVERRRVDYSGQAFTCTKTFHCVIRRGCREGDRLVFEEEGEETVDTTPGDLVVTLRAKPHPTLRRRGDKDLEVFAAAARRGDVHCAAEVETVQGRCRLVRVPALAAALAGGGVGGVWREVLPGQGLFDAREPWDKPPGDMAVHVRYPAVILAECTIATCLRLAPVYLLGSASEALPAGLVGGVVAAALQHCREAAHMKADYMGASPHLTAVCLSVFMSGEGVGEPSEAAATVLRTLRARVPGLRATAAAFVPGSCVVDDRAWCALHEADAIVLDLQLPVDGGAEEERLGAARRALEDGGVLHLLWQRAWLGCHIVAAGTACALLGAHHGPGAAAGSTAPPVLPWYLVRAGGGTSGWAGLHAAVAAAPAGQVGVGVPGSAACAVDSVTGSAELVVAPHTGALVATARWTAAHSPDAAGLRDADTDYGFFCACQSC